MAEIFRIFAVPALIAAVIGYLLGSISFSIVFTKIFNHNIDIRTMGSGNAGLTNVLRSVGVKAAVFTLIFDFGKCGAAVCIGRAVFQYVCTLHGVPVYTAQYGAYLAGIACVLGHIYPVYFGFRGGKGILSTAAMIAFIDWRVFIATVSVFIIVFLVTKIVSVSSISGAVVLPVFNFILTYFLDYRAKWPICGNVPISYVWVSSAITLAIAAVLIWEHRANIIRLKNGTEKKLVIKH